MLPNDGNAFPHSHLSSNPSIIRLKFFSLEVDIEKVFGLISIIRLHKVD